jgi:UDP-N-acetylmuramoyl-tripeptide--D-alanyl-D-alanine ligase
MKYLNPFRYIYFHLLLLQLEEYEINRYLNALKNTKGVPPNHKIRKPLKWTNKIKLIFSLTTLFFLATIFFGFFYSIYIIIISSIIYFRFTFIYLIGTMELIYPIDFLVKKIIIFLAKNKLKKNNNIKIIGIAGSYGKTGMKDLVATVLSEKYLVVKTPESFNTPIGIAKTILNRIDKRTEILIVEMGEYYPGDIKNICSIASPQIGIITGINEAHLERLKSIDNSIKTIFEIAQNMRPDGLLIMNGVDTNIKNNYKRFIEKQEVYFYHNKGKFKFNEDAPGYIYQKIFFPILGEYNLDKIDGIIYLAKKLGLTTQEIESGLKKIRTPAHRLQPVLNREKNILVIDDSYNGNPDGVEEGIKTLSLFKKRRKIFLTPGLVEIGNKSRDVHQRIGQRLNDVVDLVILVKNSVTPYIEEGLINAGFSKNNIIWFDSMMEAQNNLGAILRSGDVILFQNDWPDNYT